MTTEEHVRLVLESQSEDGGFPSYVRFGDRTEPDWNGFVTALVLRALRSVPDGPALGRARARALDFLEHCESPERPGVFGFWPRARCPAWAAGITQDADDTAVIALELFRYGRLSLSDIRRTVCKKLLCHRLGVPVGVPMPWIRPGVFLTWLHEGVHPNPIDCCVNANVVALMTAAGLSNLPGYGEACAMIQEGIRWAGPSEPRILMLIPYYPDPEELCHALRHTVECGAEALAAPLGVLQVLFRRSDPDAPPAERPVCGSSDGTVVWTSPVLAAARALEERCQ